MRHYEAYGIDLALPQVIVSLQVSRQVQGGNARSLIIPLRPQPAADLPMAHRDLTAVSDTELLGAARLGLAMGLIPLPIKVGHAFELIHECAGEKFHTVGTAIVDAVGITRLGGITEKHWRPSGFTSWADFNGYCHQAGADLQPDQNPWCWLIEFTFKG